MPVSPEFKTTVSEIQEIDSSLFLLNEKYIAINQVLDRVCRDLTKNESLQFPSLFSRIIFISQKYSLSKKLEWKLQHIRVTAGFLLKDKKDNTISEYQYRSAKDIINNFLSIVYENSISEDFENQEITRSNDIPLDKLRVQVTHINREHHLIITHAAITANDIIIRYNVSKINNIFNSTVEQLWIGAQLNLIEIKIEKETNYLIPKYIVLEPDYLIDASALAECFQNYGRSHLHYFRKKFELSRNSKHILLGNLANFFLDELVYSNQPEKIEFDETFLKAFQQSPFEFTSCNDIKEKTDFFDFMAKAKAQFFNIQRVVIQDFKKSKIDTNLCTLEPSFFCEKYGFQGRLDLLQLSEDENKTDKIVELKSGGLPYPKDDPGKIAINHETQTAIYRLIIQSVFDKTSRNISSIILYSAAENQGENLRIAAAYQHLEKEVINIRNLVVATEHNLYIGDKESVEDVFNQLFNLDNYGKTPQFFIDKLTDINKVLSNISLLEKKYFYRYISFLSRELYIQKVGDEIGNSGNSALWTSEFHERRKSFDLISDLEIYNIDDSGNDMKIRFQRINPVDFINFREGDLCILYPRESDYDTVLSNQILKGTIAEIRNNEVTVRFRYKQKNKNYLTGYKRWVIEHDRLDHTYNSMYKCLYSFLTSPATKRSLLLGIEKPKSNYNSKDDSKNLSIEEKQSQVIEKAILAEDYFLMVGPPGTGKTSIFARRLIEHFYKNSKTNILVIAYTNKAVDELCEAINQAFDGQSNFIRIGSELSCNEKYRHRLLQNISKTVQSREELRKIIYNQRIYVGTLASIVGKPELFDLKKFNVAIIDEASQIIESQIIGLLPNFDKFIMIGDHKQLSTITLQGENKSKVNDIDLNNIELNDCQESYFERLFRICKKKGWEQAYETLTYQGRMHNELSHFSNKYFYDNLLLPASEWQTKILPNFVYEKSDPYQLLAANNRICFIPNKQLNDNYINDKICEGEADITTYLSQAIINIYKNSNIAFDSQKTLGIITPYRNQIALIRHKLEKTGIPELQNIMIDTVERYQGSQRDIIIMSFCINKSYQLDFFCNLNREKTVDRKLNVALTRARQQLFLTGNEYVLRQNNIYNNLLNEIDVCNLPLTY